MGCDKKKLESFTELINVGKLSDGARHFIVPINSQ